MTNKEKIERFRQIYADFLANLDRLRKIATERSVKKIQVQEKAEIDELLSKINKDY